MLRIRLHLVYPYCKPLTPRCHNPWPHVPPQLLSAGPGYLFCKEIVATDHPMISPLLYWVPVATRIARTA